MRLGELTGGAEERQVTGFAIDHRKVAPGTVFGAFRGVRFNGEDFVADAIASGAIAVVARPEVKVEGAAHIATDHPRKPGNGCSNALFLTVGCTVQVVSFVEHFHYAMNICDRCKIFVHQGREFALHDRRIRDTEQKGAGEARIHEFPR